MTPNASSTKSILKQATSAQRLFLAGRPAAVVRHGGASTLQGRLCTRVGLQPPGVFLHQDAVLHPRGACRRLPRQGLLSMSKNVRDSSDCSKSSESFSATAVGSLTTQNHDRARSSTASCLLLPLVGHICYLCHAFNPKKRVLLYSR